MYKQDGVAEIVRSIALLLESFSAPNPFAPVWANISLMHFLACSLPIPVLPSAATYIFGLISDSSLILRPNKVAVNARDAPSASSGCGNQAVSVMNFAQSPTNPGGLSSDSSMGCIFLSWRFSRLVFLGRPIGSLYVCWLWSYASAN